MSDDSKIKSNCHTKCDANHTVSSHSNAVWYFQLTCHAAAPISFKTNTCYIHWETNAM